MPGGGQNLGDAMGNPAAGQVLVADGAPLQSVTWKNPAVSGAITYQSLLGWASDSADAVSTQIITVARIYVSKIPLANSLTVTNILYNITTASGTGTHSFAALFSSAGTVLGQSADQSAAWNATTGNYTTALATPVVAAPLQANDFLWAALYQGTAVTAATFAAATSAVALNIGTTAATSRSAYIALANTATLTSFAPASLTATTSLIWMGIS